MSKILSILFFCFYALFTFSQESKTEVPPKSKRFDDLVKLAFLESCDGWSVDEVLLEDSRRNAFLDACRERFRLQTELQTEEFSDEYVYGRLVQIRKAGKLDVKATKRANSDVDEWLPVAEIASRLMMDRFQANIDQWLVSPKLLKEFDTLIAEIVPDADRYESRKAAMKLRKSRRLQPELLTRVTDWKREIQTTSVEHAASHLASLPTNAGIYIFRDKTGFLYIGQSNNLRTRLTKHLDKSDRKSLSKYLGATNSEEITIELHVFAADSPAASTVVREAYESDLIRTRKPKFIIAP